MMESDLTVAMDETPSSDCASEAEPQAAACPDKAAEPEKREGKGPDRRNERVDRRTGMGRRQKSAIEAGYEGADRRTDDEERRTGLERRRGPGRRLSDDRKSAEEGEMSVHQFEFVMAIQTYKKINKRLYPTWTEILEIVNQLGYRKVLKRKLRLEAPEPGLTEL